ncbi:hypothetical protein Goshw_009975 [Gossypium schwendimanii]|uniref:Helicase ATP-binding domain-containing protein n=1 Tax=Gossypium schwendimanii TaxID=34291 RepID=A0A7J9NBB0_GOSSC|nr:hypothetical protein [Gossypium schwendimanii]
MSANGCFPNIIAATPPLLGWHRNSTVTSLEAPANYCQFHLRCFIRCAASTHPVTDHLLLSHSDSDSGSDWSLSPSPNTNPNPNPNSADSGSRGLTSGYTRLKAKRVKALVKRIKQEEISIGDDNNDDNRGVSEGGSYPKNAELEGSFAISHFRGWADGGSVSKPKLNSPHLPKKHLTLSTGAGSDFFSRKTFANLGCSEYMIKSLKQQLFLRPSHIQVYSITNFPGNLDPENIVPTSEFVLLAQLSRAKAFGPVIEGQSCIIADQSGSGKTLAYLAPLVQRLREEELQGVSKSSSGSPRAVIIVPTAELASQVLNSCRSLSKFGVPFRSMVVTGGFRQKTQLENLEQSVDVLIATPGRFMFLIKEGFLQLANLRR